MIAMGWDCGGHRRGKAPGRYGGGMQTVSFSASKQARTGTHLMVMLHGYGSDEGDMEVLFPALPDGVTGAAVRGGFPVGDEFGWYLLAPDLSAATADVLEAATSLFTWLDGELAAGGYTGVSLLGFSQGMAMASTLLRLRPAAFTAAVGLSGFIIESELLAMAEPLSEPRPFFWGRDRDDWVIHSGAISFTSGWLERNTVLTARTYPGMGHATGAEEMRDIEVFLRRYVAGQPCDDREYKGA